jgi:hypothetical protein
MRRRLLPISLVIGVFLSLSGCAHRAETPIEQDQRIEKLSFELQRLAPHSTPQAAHHLAQVAVDTSSNLRQQYGVTLMPWLHNIEVNSGIKKRGLCFHYANDLAAALEPQLAPYWQMYRVQARPKQLLEHNAVVITGKGQPWQSGIVLDAWRNAGVLYFGSVMHDKYPWQLKNPLAKPPIQEEP